MGSSRPTGPPFSSANSPAGSSTHRPPCAKLLRGTRMLGDQRELYESLCMLLKRFLKSVILEKRFSGARERMMRASRRLVKGKSFEP